MLLAQLLHAMQDAADEAQRAFGVGDMEMLETAKREILDLQQKVDNGLYLKKRVAEQRHVPLLLGARNQRPEA